MARKIQLKNGLTVLFIENHKSPVVSVQMWVKTGSADEDLKVAGISHFIEHLVFKGTKKYQVGEIAQVVEASGGELNAYTSFDQTVFYVTISKDFSNTALSVISEMMGFPQFDPTEIENEKEVVIEEIKRGEDNPGRASSQLLFSNMFRKHSYGRPVIGYEKVIRRIKPKDIKSYFFSRYVPKNMTLVVAGDFETKKMLPQLRESFERIPTFPLKKIKRIAEPLPAQPRIKIEEKNFQQNSFYISWPAPSVKHRDIAALEVLSMILGQSETSRLIQKFRIESALVNSIGSFVYPMQEAGLFAISFSIEIQNLEKLLKSLNQELRNLLQSGVLAEELQKAITSISANEFYSIETVDQLARKAGSYHFYMNDADYFKKYLQQIIQLKEKDIEKVIRKYLLPETIHVSGICQSNAKEVSKIFRKWISEYRKIFYQTTTNKKPAGRRNKTLKIKISKKKENSKLEVIQFKNGLTLMAQKLNETPSLVVKSAFLGGLRSENTGQPGVAELLSRTWGTGSKKYTEMQIYEIQDQLAAGIGAFSGRNSVGLSMECLNSFEKSMGELFEDILLNPVFTGEIVNREKEILINQIKKRNDNPAQVCSMNFHRLMFDGHPYAQDALGTVETAEALQPELIDRYYKGFAQAKNASLCVVGDIDFAYWKDLADKIDSNLGKGPRLDQKIKCPSLSKDQLIHTALKKEQTHIIIGYRGPSLFEKERFALDLIQSILSGQGGRLFLELRDKNSLAYSVAPIMLSGYDCGYFGGYIGCSPEKKDKSIELMIQEFQKLGTHSVSDEELARAKRYLIGRHDIELQRKSAINNSYLFDQIYGFDPNRSLHIAEEYAAVSKQDILSLSQKIFSGFKVISTVGP